MTILESTSPVLSASESPEGVIRITGRVSRPFAIHPDELRKMDSEELKELAIYCGTGEPKGKISGCKGVLLENVIRLADVIKEQSGDTKKMFVVASSDDGYTTVFSWQEIFNSPMGGGILILHEMDGKPLAGDHGRLALISSEDYFTGARFVKRLKTIELRIV